MKKLLLPLVAVGLSACGGGTSTFSDPNNLITETPKGVTLAGDSKTFAQSASGFSVVSGTTPVSIERTDSNPPNASLSQRTYKLIVGGTTYNLGSYDASTKSYSNNNNVQLFLNENSANASIINPQITNGGNTKQYFGVVGDLTPVANLPTSTATYTGNSLANNGTVGEISIDNDSLGSDDTTSSVVTLNVNFGAAAGSQVTGQFVISDSATDGRGGVEIAATSPVTVPISNGTITGNTFSAEVDLTNLANVTTNSGNAISLSTNAPLDGGFYGPNAENAAGVGLSIGSTAGSSNDILVYTRVIAK